MNMFYRNPVAEDKRKKEKLRQPNIKEAWDKFNGNSSSIYCLKLVLSRVII